LLQKTSDDQRGPRSQQELKIYLGESSQLELDNVLAEHFHGLLLLERSAIQYRAIHNMDSDTDTRKSEAHGLYSSALFRR